MLKFVLAALWVSAATVGSTLYAFQLAQERKSAVPPPAFFGGLEHVRTGVISVPVVAEGEVGGYFLVRLVYMVEPQKLKALSLPADLLFVDELHSYLYANPQINFSDRSGLDLDALRNGLRDSVNARVDDKLVHDVIVEQVDYLSKAEIRDNTIRRRIGPAD